MRMMVMAAEDAARRLDLGDHARLRSGAPVDRARAARRTTAARRELAMNPFTTTLSRAPGSVATARQLVHAQTSSLDRERRADAALMVSELVTNALVHGTGKISLRIDLKPERLRPANSRAACRRVGSAGRQHESLVQTRPLADPALTSVNGMWRRSSQQASRFSIGLRNQRRRNFMATVTVAGADEQPVAACVVIGHDEARTSGEP